MWARSTSHAGRQRRRPGRPTPRPQLGARVPAKHTFFWPAALLAFASPAAKAAEAEDASLGRKLAQPGLWGPPSSHQGLLAREMAPSRSLGFVCTFVHTNITEQTIPAGSLCDGGNLPLSGEEPPVLCDKACQTPGSSRELGSPRVAQWGARQFPFPGHLRKG